jgi:hypothetical protein
METSRTVALSDVGKGVASRRRAVIGGDGICMMHVPSVGEHDILPWLG